MTWDQLWNNEMNNGVFNEYVTASKHPRRVVN